jgi:hypothetical protein
MESHAMSNGTNGVNGNGTAKKILNMVVGYLVVAMITSFGTWVWTTNTDRTRTADKVEVLDKQCSETKTAVESHTLKIADIDKTLGIVNTKLDGQNTKVDDIKRWTERLSDRLDRSGTLPGPPLTEHK